MTFTNISTLVSSCPLNPAGKMTNLMVAVLRSDQVPPGELVRHAAEAHGCMTAALAAKGYHRRVWGG
jgi:hypothetical protein